MIFRLLITFLTQLSTLKLHLGASLLIFTLDQDGLRMGSGWAQDGLRMGSGWDQDGLGMGSASI